MDSSTRVIVNTMAQYIRTIVSAVIALYTSRIILEHLGVNDYGINDLVAGIIAMLSFINLSLSQSVQRFLSYYQGKNDSEMVKKVFNNSIIIQLLIATILCSVFIAITKPLFCHILVIDPDRQNAAHWIYYFMILSLFFNMVQTPFMAALIARENIVFSSIVQVGDSMLKIPVALSLAWVSSDKLIWYGFCGFVIVLLDFLVYWLYCLRKYTETAHFTFSDFDKGIFKELFAFSGWTVYGTACLITRSRGLAILINRFFTVAVNGAMGIGSMVSSQLSFLSTSLTTAIRPQIFKAEASGNRQRMFYLTEICCKSSILLLSLIAIPAIFEMPDLMSIWLKDVPEYAVFFAQAFIVSALVDQLTVGLQVANQAIGDIKKFTICTYSIKLGALPCMYMLYRLGYDVESAMYVYITFELICSIVRLWFLKITINYPIKRFLQNVIIPLILPLATSIVLCYNLASYMENIYFLVTFIIDGIVFCLMAYCFGLKREEKQLVINKIKSFKGKNRT